MWGLWWTKRHWGRFSPSNSVSTANHSTNFSIIIFTRGQHNRPLVAAVPSGPWIPPPTIPILILYGIHHIRREHWYSCSSAMCTDYECRHVLKFSTKRLRCLFSYLSYDRNRSVSCLHELENLIPESASKSSFHPLLSLLLTPADLYLLLAHLSSSITSSCPS
jgi:hypothetical protein